MEDRAPHPRHKDAEKSAESDAIPFKKIISYVGIVHNA